MRAIHRPGRFGGSAHGICSWGRQRPRGPASCPASCPACSPACSPAPGPAPRPQQAHPIPNPSRKAPRVHPLPERTVGAFRGPVEPVEVTSSMLVWGVTVHLLVVSSANTRVLYVALVLLMVTCTHGTAQACVRASRQEVPAAALHAAHPALETQPIKPTNQPASQAASPRTCPCPWVTRPRTPAKSCPPAIRPSPWGHASSAPDPPRPIQHTAPRAPCTYPAREGAVAFDGHLSSGREEGRE